MAQHFLIGGGTGFIGKALCRYLEALNCKVTVISRLPAQKHVTWHDIEQRGLPTGITAVVNLAGQNVLDPTRRWTPGFKQNVYNSRINTSKALVNAIVNATQKPDVYVGITGVSSYPNNGPDMGSTEDFGVKVNHPTNFMSKLCNDWEQAMKLPADISTRLVTIRTGVVLGREGGMIKQLLLPFWFGFGGPIGSGDQPLPWIHIDDLVRLIWFCANQLTIAGVVNGVAPQLITNKQFSKAFGKAMFRPAVLSLPEAIVNLVFNKERAILLTQGPRVVPDRAPRLGFTYIYPDINSACKSVAYLLG